MIRSSIRTKILAIAVGMIVLMVITAVLSLTLVTQVGHRLEQMTNSYIPADGNLARGNIRSLERALALRRMVIAKSRWSPDQATSSTAREVFDETGAEVVREAQSARTLINGLITQSTHFADGAALARIVHDITTLDAAFVALTKDRLDGLMLPADTFLVSQRNRIAQFAIENKLPSVYSFREYIEAGGLVAYTPNYHDLFRRAAKCVDKILRGTKPGEIPIEHSTRFQLLINLKTARAIGLTVPPRLLA